MTRLLGVVLGIWLLIGPAAAQDEAAIRDVIGAQLDAFNARDVNDAWQYASPTIQGLFGTPENFGRMVENGYPMVWTNSNPQFLDLREIAGQWYQRVLIEDATGIRHILEYQMLQTADGWRIGGVSILPAPDVAA